MTEYEKSTLIITSGVVVALIALMVFIFALAWNYQETRRMAIKQGYIEVQDRYVGSDTHWEKAKQ